MAINKLSVLEAGFPEDAAFMEASFFENLHRCRVIIVNMGMNSYRIGIAQIIFHGLFDGFGHDTLVPIRLGKPVAQFGVVPLYIRASDKTDITCCS